MQAIKTFLSHGIEFSCKQSALQHDKLIDAYEQLRFAKREVEQLKQGCVCTDYTHLPESQFESNGEYMCKCCGKWWNKSAEGVMSLA